MRKLRVLMIVVLAAVTLGTLGYTLGTAWYIRSAAYRAHCSAVLSEELGLPSDIEEVVPRSWTAREFRGVTVWLPERRGKAMRCERAIVRNTPTKSNPDAYELDLLGGTCEISTRTWLREDYRRVIESGLRPGFSDEGLQQVHFAEMDVQFRHEGFRAAIEDARGVVVFAEPESGWALIECDGLNGHETSEPIRIDAQFSPRGAGVQVDQVELRVPPLPMGVLDLRRAAGLSIEAGTFQGALAYTESGEIRTVHASGTCYDLNLEECTAGLLPRAWQGCCPEIELQELHLENGVPQRLRFRGELTGLVLGDVLAPWGLEDVGGQLSLRVRDADFSLTGIKHLEAAGECAGVSLARLTEYFGWGVMSGQARLTIQDLVIEDNRLASLEAELRVEPNDEPQWIEGRLVAELIRRVLMMNVPPWLPERIGYTKLGLRVDVKDEVLRVFGTHGDREKTILTVSVFGQEIPLIHEPETAFELKPWLDQARAEGQRYLDEGLRRLRAEQRQRAAESQANDALEEMRDSESP